MQANNTNPGGRVQLPSDRKTIKSIEIWRYEVTLSQDDRGIFHVGALNKLTNKLTELAFSDFGMALYAFDVRVAAFEGI